MRKEFLKQFLENTDETGRLIVISIETGRRYFVEVIDRGKPHKLWGDVDPASKKLTGDYGNKYKGAVTEAESIITEENGFEEITVVKGSYMTEIMRREKEHLKNKENNS